MRTKPASLVARPRLVQQSQIIASEPPRFVLITGLPGSGKSVALDAIIAASPHPIGLARLRRGAPVNETALLPAIYQLGLSTHNNIVETLSRVESPLVLAIDDLHHALDEYGAPLPEAAAWLAESVQNPSITLVATTRRFPDWPLLARLAVLDQLALLDAHDLAFTEAECAELWQIHHLPAEALDWAEMCAATNGWAGLTALACRHGWPPDPALTALLLDDVLLSLPPVQRTMLQTLALVADFTPPLLKAIAPIADGARTLHEWQRVGVVETTPTLHVAPLLRATLQRSLRTDSRAHEAAVRQIARHYAANDQWTAMLDVTRRSQLWPIAMELLEQYSIALYDSGRHAEVVTWLADVPPADLSVEVGSLLARCYVGLNDREGALLLLNRLHHVHPDPLRQRTLHLLKANIYQAAGNIAAADSLVVPYLEDTTLHADDRARVLRLHGIALASHGAEDNALHCFERAAALLEDQGASRLVGLVLGDYANVAARVGRYRLAERLLRRAERIWRDLSEPPPPDLATTLNMQAVVALHTGRMDEAERLAAAAYVHALASNRLRAAVGAMTTQGDIALAQRQWSLAAQRYEVAHEQMHHSGDVTLQPYVLAMYAQVLRHHDDPSALHTVRHEMAGAPSETALDRAWLAAGNAAISLRLNDGNAAAALQTALADLGQEPTLAHGLLLLLLAEAHWQADERGAAQTAWAKLDQLLLDGRGGLPVLLEPLARHSPDLVQEARTNWHSVFAGRLAQNGKGAQSATQAAPSPLTLRVLGQTSLLWHGQAVVGLPRNTLVIFTLLLLAGGAGMTADQLRERAWSGEMASIPAWRKTLERIRKAMPESIVFDGATYRLGVPFEAIDADLLLVRGTPLVGASALALRNAAQAVAQPLLPGLDDPWVIGERRALAQRGAELWFALGTLENDDGNANAAAEAFATALRLSPLHERAVIAAMTLALVRGERSSAITLYHTYNQQLVDELGLDPGPDIETLYRHALEG